MANHETMYDGKKLGHGVNSHRKPVKRTAEGRRTPMTQTPEMWGAGGSTNKCKHMEGRAMGAIGLEHFTEERMTKGMRRGWGMVSKIRTEM